MPITFSQPIGEMTAAVPLAKISCRLPSFDAATTSSIESFRSETFTPHFFSSWMTESRVMPGRIVPESSGAVITSSAIRKKAFDVPISSTYLCSAASSHSTSLQLYFIAS